MEEAVYSTPFATLLHFKKATGAGQPRVLLVAPMSGHFATLLREVRPRQSTSPTGITFAMCPSSGAASILARSLTIWLNSCG